MTVRVRGDTLDEIDETFTVNLADAVNAVIADGTGVGTITDDDPPPTVSVDNATVTEGDTGTVDANFTVSLSAASGKTITSTTRPRTARRRRRPTTPRRPARSRSPRARRRRP